MVAKLKPILGRILKFLERWGALAVSLIAVTFSIYTWYSLSTAELLRFQHAQTLRFIDEVNQLDTLAEHYPFVTEYNEKVFSNDPSEDTAARYKRLKKQFSELPLEKQQIVLLDCEHLANFMDGLIM